MNFDENDRGVSELVGLSLLLALSLTTASVILFYGSAEFTSLQDQTSEQQGINTMSKISSEIITVSFGTNGTRRVIEPGLVGTQSSGNSLNISNESHITVKTKNGSSGATSTVLGLDEQEMGSLNYKTNDTVISIENGGLWKKGEKEKNKMLSSPQFNYRGTTLTLPLIIFNDSKQITDKKFEIVKESQVNKNKHLTIDNNTSVIIEVHSKHYKAWEDFFISHIEANATTETYDTNKTVRVELPLENPVFTTVDTPIIANGDVQATQNSNINGGVDASGDVNGEANINGNSNEFATHTHSTMNQLIVEKKNEIQSSGTNVDLNDSGSMALSSGQYYTEDIWMNNEVLELDVSGGDVEIYVDKDVYLKETAEIRVTNTGASSGEARIYVNGDYSLEKSDPSAKIISGDNSTKHQIYGTSDTDISITQNATFEGLIYAPTDSSEVANAGGPKKDGTGNGEACLDSTFDVCVGGNATVTGAIVGGSTTVGQSSTVTYDSDLSGFTPTWAEKYFGPRLFYLHVSKNKLQVDET